MRDDQGFGDHLHRVEADAGDRRPQEADVEQPRLQRVDLVAADHLLEDQVDAGELRAAPGEQRRQEALHRAAGEADLDRARLARGDRLRDQGGALRQLEQPLRLGEEAAAGRGDAHRAAGALEQLGLERMLEDLDLPAQRRLRHVQPRRRPPEVKLLGDRDETAELAEIEHAGQGLVGAAGRGQ